MNELSKAVYAIIIAFFTGVIVCPWLIPVLTKLKFGQTERDDGPQSHLKKSGTPTMGGIAILISVLVSCAVFVFSGDMSSDGIAALLVTFGFGLIGFADDYIKVVKKRSLGLKAKQKIIGQAGVCAVLLWYIYTKTDVGTGVFIPFMNGFEIDLGMAYPVFFFIAVLGTVNGVNLTDGLDGLAGGVTLIVAAFLLMASWAAGNSVMYLSAAVIGALLAFLLFNAYPAKVFMGDTGSLALGGFVAVSAILLKMPVFILLIGFIYLIESLSVIIQVSYYKKTHKRVFKMAPIHHHFELSGWSETKIVALFYVITAMMCLVAFLGARGLF